jgi:CheY-like chemotaxis protein
MQLLLVEDSENLVKVISHFIEGLFDEIVVEDTLRGALMRVEAEVPDVIWLDLILKDSGGESTIRAIPRFRALCPDSTIVVMSGVPDIKHRVLDMGADAFLSKDSSIKAAQIVGLLGMGCMNRISAGSYEKQSDLLEKVAASLIKLLPPKTAQMT